MLVRKAATRRVVTGRNFPAHNEQFFSD
jgi:hypothetical protein